jgi:hypothetical protein
MTGFDSKRSAAADKLQEPSYTKKKPKLMLEKFREMKNLLDDTAPLQPAQDVDYWIREATAARQAEMALRRELEAQPVQEPVAWTLLLTGEHHGIIGEAGEKFIGAPECYQRVNVYTAPPLPVQPVQEPVGTLNISRYKGHLVNHDFDYFGELPDGTYSVYTTPPQREWVGLTDEEVHDCIKFPTRNLFARDGTTSQRIARATEAKLKEKNNG